MEHSNLISLLIVFRTLGEDMVANGVILGIDSYEESNIYSQCIKKNCLLNISAKALTIVNLFYFISRSKGLL